MNVSDVLNQAADLIEPEGAWMRLDSCGNNLTGGSHCVVTAVDHVAHVKAGQLGLDHLTRARLFVDARVAFAEHVGIDLWHIPRWNDDPTTTQELVVKTLRTVAAEQERAQ